MLISPGLTIDRFLTVPIRGVIHVGAHHGEERDWYVSHGNPLVIWIEPLTTPFNTLSANIASYKRQKAFNTGFHDILKKSDFNITDDASCVNATMLTTADANSLKTSKKVYVDKIKDVTLERIDDFIDKEKIDKEKIDIKTINFLNIDCQGIELNVLRSLGAYISSLDYIYTEFSEEDLALTTDRTRELTKYLEKSGFKFRCSVLPANDLGCTLYIKK